MPIRLPLDVLEGMAREHVHYEVDRLVWWSHVQIPVRWFNVTSASDPNVADYVQLQVAQASLEAALIHLRNVAEFLTATRPGKEKRSTLDRHCRRRLLRRRMVTAGHRAPSIRAHFASHSGH